MQNMILLLFALFFYVGCVLGWLSGNFVGGLGGDDISETQVHGMYRMLVQAAEGTGELPRVSFLGIDSPADALGAERGR